MVRIFSDNKGSGEFVIQTTATDTDTFISEFAEALAKALGEAVGVVPSQLSLIENGRREPKLSLLTALAGQFGVTVADLLNSEAPDRRSELEIEVERLQRSGVYQQLKLPAVRSTKSMPTEALEAIVTKSMESGMGARRLCGITSHALHRIFFDVPSMVKAGRAIRIVVTERTIEDPADYDVSMAV